tara:strand:+ start:502 stop:756 length:255 start_codon:yes stop_codon:yes gene_type:complete
MTKDLKNYVVDDQPKIQPENMSVKDLISLVKNLTEANRFHQEQNGELREKMATVRKLRRENTELRNLLELKKPLVLTEDMEVKE